MSSQRPLNKVVHYFIYSLFLVLTISGIVLSAYFVNAGAQQSQQQKQLLQQTWLTTSISEAVYRYDLPGVKALASQAMQNDWLVGISVHNERNIPLIAQGLNPVTAEASSLEEQATNHVNIETLLYDDEVVGAVHYLITPVELQINPLSLVRAVSILIVLVFLLSLLVRWFVETKITQHINKLTNVLNLGNTEQLMQLSVQQDVPKEIGLLAAEFMVRNDQLVSQAEEDFLTKLPNRRAFESKLDRSLSSRVSFVLGLIDIDNFKQVNDHFGHDVGDVLLVSCAQVLRETITEKGFAARLGGDEFAFILECETIDAATEVADNIINGVKKVSNDAPEIRLNISASIGLAGPLGEVSAPDALRYADIALYKSKNAGRARYTVYCPGFDEQPKRWIQVQTALNQGLSAGHLNYELETISYTHNQENYGVEMLLRLKDDDGNVIPPLEVIDVAIQTGQLEAFSQMTIDAGITTLRHSPDISNVFLNFNGMELSKLDTPEFFEKIEQLGKLKHRLVFEVTESTYLEDPEIINILKKLRNNGIRIALGDFGTGYSSLSCLNSLVLDFVKIDNSTVDKAFKDHRSRAVLRAILTLRQEFYFEVIAEGIESEQVLNFMRNEGVVLGQGYFLQANEK